jgi:hypothetical protein
VPRGEAVHPSTRAGGATAPPNLRKVDYRRGTDGAIDQDGLAGGSADRLWLLVGFDTAEQGHRGKSREEHQG